MGELKLFLRCRKCKKNILKNNTFDIDMSTLKLKEKLEDCRFYDFIAICPHCKTRNEVFKMPLIYFNPTER
jgi:hypothetical protein